MDVVRGAMRSAVALAACRRRRDLKTSRVVVGRRAPARDRRRAARGAGDSQRRRRQAEHPAERGAPARPCWRGTASPRRFWRPTGNPLVYGALNVPGATRTVLFYCHYDGQPVDPKAWKQPDPFTPVLRRGRLAGPARHAAIPQTVARYDPEIAHLRAVRVRRQGADRRAACGGRRVEGVGHSRPRRTCASSSTARRRPARRASCRRSRATRTSCAPT